MDLNLLYDVNPEAFLTHIPQFVDELGSVEFLNLFINQLSPEPEGKELKFMRPKSEEQRIMEAHRQELKAAGLLEQAEKG